MNRTSAVEISDMSCVSEARRTAGRIARDLDLGGEYAGRAELIATEAASNIV